MFEQMKQSEPTSQAFLALYAKFQTGTAWLAKRKAEGLDNRPHLGEFRRLEAKVNKAWDKFSDYEKDEILNCLKSSLPEGIMEIKEMFNGKIISLT